MLRNQDKAKEHDERMLRNNDKATDALYKITAQTKLLVEIKDIRDELAILQMAR